MEITGRMVADAQVHTTKTEKEVTGFTLAIDDRYRKKGDMEVTKVVTYVDCSYWFSTAIAPYLTKGTIVQVTGRLEQPRIWTGKDGEAHASLPFTVSNIKILGGGSRANGSSPQPAGKPTGSPTAEPEAAVEDEDDLPF